MDIAPYDLVMEKIRNLCWVKELSRIADHRQYRIGQ
jgi:hypothetical protein